MTSRSAFASERLRHFSACTLCTNQNAPARKRKTATIPHRRALMRKVRNFWSSRYTRMTQHSVLPPGGTSRGLDRFLPKEQREQLIHQHPEQTGEDRLEHHALLEHLDPLSQENGHQQVNDELVDDDGADQTGAECECAAQHQPRVD